jgi:hypothetical protein
LICEKVPVTDKVALSSGHNALAVLMITGAVPVVMVTGALMLPEQPVTPE